MKFYLKYNQYSQKKWAENTVASIPIRNSWNKVSFPRRNVTRNIAGIPRRNANWNIATVVFLEPM